MASPSMTVPVHRCSLLSFKCHATFMLAYYNWFCFLPLKCWFYHRHWDCYLSRPRACRKYCFGNREYLRPAHCQRSHIFLSTNVTGGSTSLFSISFGFWSQMALSVLLHLEASHEQLNQAGCSGNPLLDPETWEMQQQDWHQGNNR